MRTNCVYTYKKYDIFTDSYLSSNLDYISRRCLEVIMCVHVFRVFRNKKCLLGSHCVRGHAQSGPGAREMRKGGGEGGSGHRFNS